MKNIRIVYVLAAAVFMLNAILQFAEKNITNGIMWMLGSACWIASTIIQYRRVKRGNNSRSAQK